MNPTINELKVSKAIMQLEKINSEDANDITTKLYDFGGNEWYFVRGSHQKAALDAATLINKLNHNATEALREVERLCKMVDGLNDARYKDHQELVKVQNLLSDDRETISLSKTNFINLQKRFDNQTGALNRTNTALITAEEKYRVAVEEYKTLDAVNQELNSAIDNYDKTLAKTEKEVSDLKAESLANKAEVAMLNERVNSLIINGNEMEAKAKAEKDDADYYKKQYENLCRKLQDLADEG